MKQDMFKYLPSEIIINILSRLNVVTIASSKCVCKSWLDLLETDYFVKFHLSTSAATLAVLTVEGNESRCTVFDLEDEIDVDQSHDCRYNFPHRVTIEGFAHGLICVGKNEVNANALYVCNPLTKVNFPYRVTIEGSVNGLLFLHTKYMVNFHALYVFNPISREYIEFQCPVEFVMLREDVYGFGASKITGQHKVVWIEYNNNDCHVYTLGTGLWRRVEAASASLKYDYCTSGTFANGHLHWIVYSNATMCISCFDLETECFSTLVPPFQGITNGGCYAGLFVLRDCLCYSCDDASQEGQIVIWLMKEYGDKKSWTKEYVIGNLDFDRYGEVFVYPIKVFKDGSILMVWKEQFLYYYSNKTETTQKIGVFNGGNNYIIPMLLTPSFLSLKSFQMEKVISL